MKKIISFVLTFALLLGMRTAVLAAAPAVTLTVSQNEIEAGDEITVTVALSSAITVGSGSLTLTAEQFTLMGGEWQMEDTVIQNINTAEGVGVFAFNGSRRISGTVAILTLKAREAASAASIQVALTLKNGGNTVLNRSGTASVKVNAPVVPVTGVEIKSATALTVSGTETLIAAVKPANATNPAVSWSSDNTAVATVDAAGKVTAKSAGTANITVKTADGNFTSVCAVTVNVASVPVTGVSLKSAVTLAPGATETLIPSLTPSHATNQRVTWYSDNTAVAMVDADGKVTAKSAGTANITVKTADGSFTAVCAVTVADNTAVRVTGVSLNRNSLDMTVGSTATLLATVSPANAENKAVVWQSSKPTVATVSETGLITAKAIGTTTVSVTALDGHYVASCTVSVGQKTPDAAYGIETAGRLSNGTVTSDKTAAVRGTTVTLTAVPAEGFEADTVTAVTASGVNIPLKMINQRQYTFTMPEESVLVSAAFVRILDEIVLCTKDDACVIAKFRDCDTAAWYHDGIHFCVNNALMQGVSANEFDPNGATTRAMIVTLLWRIEGCPAVNYAMTFDDVKNGLWYTEAIRWAQSNGVVQGYSEAVFAPMDPITREQLATILCRYAACHGKDVSAVNSLSGFTDADQISSWALPAMRWANGKGLIQGRTATTLVPSAGITRAEAATMLQRYCTTVR